MSSLTSTNIFNIGSSALPTFSFEARVHGDDANELITQLGLSLTSNYVDVAFFTRTSGFVLIAGVGSYCAYRICANYLGKEFVWTLIDAARLDRLSRADNRLLHPAAEGYLTSRQSAAFYEEQARQRLLQLLRSLFDDERVSTATGLSVLRSSDCQSASISHASSVNSQKSQRYRLLSKRSGSPIRVICAPNQLLRKALRKPSLEKHQSNAGGLGSILWESSKRGDNLTLNTREHVPLQTDDELCDTLSGLTSVSQAKPPQALLHINCCVDNLVDNNEDRDDEDAWSSQSLCRRSFGGVEPLSWDDFDGTDFMTAANLLAKCSSLSDISELSAMKNLEEMWATSDDRVNSHRDSSATSLIFRSANDQEETASLCTTNLAALIESKCSVQSSSWMYQSVHVDDDTTSCVSESNQSVLSTNFTVSLGASHDLWEFANSFPSRHTQHEKETDESSVLQAKDCEASASQLRTSSYVGKLSSSLRCVHTNSADFPPCSKSQRKSAMFDSAIGTDVLSSDDDQSSMHGLTTTNVFATSARDDETGRQGVKAMPKRLWLDKISEKSSPHHQPRRSSVVSSAASTELSLEWYDEVSKVMVPNDNSASL